MMKLSIPPKRMVMGAMIVAGLVGLASILDLILAIPFNGMMMFDIMTAISAALVGYMGWEAYREIN